MDVLEWLLIVLAVYRVSRLIPLERGPFDVFLRIRSFHADRNDWIGAGLNCVNCVSFWIALIAALVLHLTVVEGLSIAGAVVIVNEVLNQ